MGGERPFPREITDRAFDEYVAAYNPSDPKISLKISHTRRVAALCERIARGVNADDIDLAWLMGMLHDTGRFEQIRIYNTFSDAQSVDHAAFGADLLFKDGLIARFAPDLSRDRLKVLERAIRCHSAYRLDPDMTGRERLYAEILRDADKIDIFRVNCETPLEEIYNVSTRELKNSPVSEDVRKCFVNRTAVPRNERRSPADYAVAIVCLKFELVFPVSRAIAREQGYVDRLLSFQSDNAETAEWFTYMQNHVWDD